jgi:hypothetical protein
MVTGLPPWALYARVSGCVSDDADDHARVGGEQFGQERFRMAA